MPNTKVRSFNPYLNKLNCPLTRSSMMYSKITLLHIPGLEQNTEYLSGLLQ